ncbi:MAG: sulfotransferase [Proteobacteria bacterium]|nr:sulfotransferase [Pseudomonadota bacterium]
MDQLTAETSVLPNFIVVGASKAGTTSLHHYLSQHPEIFLPGKKESYYFLSSGLSVNFEGPWEKYTVNRDRTSSWADYLDLFKGSEDFPARGEVCPSYLRTPGTAEKVHEKLGDIKIIAMLRNPVYRAYSQYCMRLGLGLESLGFEEALTAEPERIKRGWFGGSYFLAGLYGEQLARYYQVYPRENIKVLLYEDFVESPQGSLTEICDFLGVSSFGNWDTAERHNKSGDISNPLLRFLWTKSNTPRGKLRPFLPAAIRNRASFWINRLSRSRPTLRQETITRLLEGYSEDISACEELTGIDLEHWRRG